LGYTSDDAIKLLASQRTVANPTMWYVKKRIQLFEKYWQNKVKVKQVDESQKN
jgi:hypothetical protein